MKKIGLIIGAALLASPAQAETVAVVGGTVAIGDGSQPIPNGTVVFKDDRIVAAGANVAIPPGATIVDAKGKWVSAGVISGWSSLGVDGLFYEAQENDGSAPRSPFSAALDLSTSINPRDATIEVDRSRGITRAFVTSTSGRTIFGGQGAVISLAVQGPSVTKARAYQQVELGETGSERAGGSRAAAIAFLRAALIEARDYVPGAGKEAPFEGLTRFDVAALVPAVNGEQALYVHVERASDIEQVLELRKEFPKLRLVLAGAAEGWMVAPKIAAAGVPVVAVGIKTTPFAFEALAATDSNVGRMTAAGVNVGVSIIDYSRIERQLPQIAGNLVAISKVPGKTGLSWGQAFATITSKPAQAMGLDGEIGSLRAGRRADVVLWDGDPLEAATVPIAVYIDGRAQPMTTHLTKLRDRYLTPEETNLPKAYDR
ncbi:amidohydrolase family protein [Sphingopyxis panaciterrae]